LGRRAGARPRCGAGGNRGMRVGEREREREREGERERGRGRAVARILNGN
jgi:hypothetical protein